MTDMQLVAIGSMVCMIMIGLLSYAVISRQQRTIDALTSKLMAKNYQEYARTQKSPPTGNEPKTSQLSWFDDPQEVKEDSA